MSVARRVSVAGAAAASSASAAPAKAPVLTDDALSSSFLTKGACADVKRFLLAAQTGVPAAPKFRKIIQFALDAITTEVCRGNASRRIRSDLWKWTHILADTFAFPRLHAS